MLDATLSRRLDDLLACDCSTSPLVTESTPQALARLLTELEEASAYPD